MGLRVELLGVAVRNWAYNKCRVNKVLLLQFYRANLIHMVAVCITRETQEMILFLLATQVISARGLGETAINLMKDQKRLHSYVLRTPVSWRRIANEVGEERNRIYHWYHETHSRNILNIKMTNEDRGIIRALIIQGIRDRSIFCPGFYQKIRARFGAKYPRPELRMTYNNALRSQTVRSVLDECRVELPPRRPYRRRAKTRESDTKRSPNKPIMPLSQLISALSSIPAPPIPSVPPAPCMEQPTPLIFQQPVGIPMATIVPISGTNPESFLLSTSSGLFLGTVNAAPYPVIPSPMQLQMPFSASPLDASVYVLSPIHFPQQRNLSSCGNAAGTPFRGEWFDFRTQQ